MIEMMIFFTGSILLLWISLPSLKIPRSHGYYRFFSWEAILGMFCINVRHWFFDPFAWSQVISWILLCVSLALLISGVVRLRASGKPTDALEATTHLVQTGIYRYIRHPLYASLLFLSWGIFLKQPTLLEGCLTVIAAAFLLATGRADESECMTKFGQEYSSYMKKTKMFIPFVI